MKKILVSAAAAALAGGLAFADLTFSNEVSSDIVHVTKVDRELHGLDDAADERDTDFAGISNKMTVDFTSERVDAGVMAEFTLDDFMDDDEFFGDSDFYGERIHNSDYKGVMGLKFTDVDWYAEFRPIDILALGLSCDYYTDGSYLPVWDDNVGAGALGSDGVTLTFKPAQLQGLKIAATLPFTDKDEETNWFGIKRYKKSHVIWGGKIENTKKDPETGEIIPDDEDKVQVLNVGLGAEYSLEGVGVFGATVKDAFDIDQIKTGAFVSINAFENVVFNGGFTLARKDSAEMLKEVDFWKVIDIQGRKLLNFGLSCEREQFSVALDVASNFGEKYEEAPYDLYIGANFGFNLNQELTLGITALYFNDLKSNGDRLDSAWGLSPSLTYAKGSHELSVGFCYESVADKDSYIGIPVSYKYSF